ncbi:hypothetical protein J7643_17195 [bacterium]|nr:hypothetical protein [bacterium]
MQLTIVVYSDRPTFKAMPLIQRLFTQSVRDLDVLLACTSPPLDLEAVQAEYPVTLLEFPTGSSTSAMLNVAFARSQTELVVTLDGSWMPRDDKWLLALTRHFGSNPQVVAVSGCDFDPSRVSIRAPWYAQDLLDFLAAPDYGLNFANAAFRRDAWRTWAFENSDAVSADKRWAYQALQAGNWIVMDYDARCHQGEAPSDEAQFRRYWALNLSFGNFIQAREDLKGLWQQALTECWRYRSVAPLQRLYRMEQLIRRQRYWRPGAAQALLAREHFARGGKWAV